MVANVKPLVAIVGRPNVGKSTFFNKIVGQRLSIVEDTPGVTRDRIYGDAEWLSYAFTLIDTGGIELTSEDVFFTQMRRQAELAVEMADVILFFTDAREGMLAQDKDVAEYLRRRHHNIILVVNKVDSPRQEDAIYDFYALGLGEPYAISAQQGLGLGDLLDEVVKNFPKAPEEEGNSPVRIAVAGRPNAGKSSLVNRLLGSERAIVSNVPGTTRDALDAPFTYHGSPYILVDTAGIRRKRSIEDSTIERYSVIRSLDAIRRADVVVVMIDAEAGIAEQDVKIAGYANQQGKACVVVVNKWDLIEKDTKTAEAFRQKILADLAFMDYVQIQFISVKTGQRIGQVMEGVTLAYSESQKRIPTGILNDALHDAMAVNQPPADRGRRLKIFYITQVDVGPPLFLLYINYADRMHFSYLRYLENHLRKTFGFSGTPIKLVLKEREDNNDAI